MYGGFKVDADYADAEEKSQKTIEDGKREIRRGNDFRWKYTKWAHTDSERMRHIRFLVLCKR